MACVLLFMDMSRIRRLIVWLGRIGRCRGFGVQSPWAYRMVRYVINEHYPYYAYSRLREAFPHLGVEERKICELCLRLANSVRPATVAVSGAVSDALRNYISAGYRKVVFAEAYDMTDDSPMCSIEMAVIAPNREMDGAFEAVSRGARDGTVAMLLDIYRDKAMRRLWRDTVTRMPGVVTFDLYYCGLVFFDRKRYKQNYIINF